MAKALLGEAATWHPSPQGRIPRELQLVRTPCDIQVDPSLAHTTAIATFRQSSVERRDDDGEAHPLPSRTAAVYPPSSGFTAQDSGWIAVVSYPEKMGAGSILPIVSEQEETEYLLADRPSLPRRRKVMRQLCQATRASGPGGHDMADERPAVAASGGGGCGNRPHKTL